METPRNNNDNDEEDPPQPVGTQQLPSPAPDSALSPSSDAAAASPRISLPHGDDDAAPEPPQQTAAEYEAMDVEAGVSKNTGVKPESIDADEAPMPPSQQADDSKGRPEGSTSSSNFGGQQGEINELSPPVPFNAAAFVDDDDEIMDEKIAASATPPTRQAEPNGAVVKNPT